MLRYTGSVEWIPTNHFPYEIRKVPKGALKINEAETAEILRVSIDNYDVVDAAQSTKPMAERAARESV